MRPFIQLTLLIVVSLFAAFTGQAQTNKKVAAPASNVKQLEVVYFHSEHRCKTCIAIEKQTKAVLDKHFAKEVKSGGIVLKTYNVDEKANLKICQKFDAFGSFALLVLCWSQHVSLDSIA